MKCILIVTKSETVLTFRRSLIEKLKESGYAVGVIAHDEDRKEDIAKLGITFYCVQQDNRGLNPVSSLQYGKKITEILKAEKPDIVFTFQLKPNTFGVQAAKKAGVEKIFSMVEGAGDVFINNTAKWKAIRFVVCRLYKAAFCNCQKVFFLNEDDKGEFIRRGIVPEEKSRIVHGIGVDLERFACKPVKDNRNFLMIARMLKTKGVLDYCRCAQLVKKRYPDARFCYLGAEGTVTLEDIQQYIDDGSVEYLGTTKDVRPYLEACDVFVLPSYREGMPMSVMEAESTGRSVITTDVVGCRDTVVDRYNGFIVPVQDAEALAEKCIYMIENPQEAIRMGENSRSYAQQQFDQKIINQTLLEEIQG